jgi:adenine-specific DNA-methyltransferase
MGKYEYIPSIFSIPMEERVCGADIDIERIRANCALGNDSVKYMGSKRSMLANGLGTILKAESAKTKQFGDLFVGSGAVSWYIAENTSCRVLASDLQLFAVSLAEAVITRRRAADPERIWESWYRHALQSLEGNTLFSEAKIFDGVKWEKSRRRSVAEARELCSESSGPVTRAYGGHYFSPKQGLCLDALRQNLPRDPHRRSIALAALICAASECAAAPGHTAQPFQPTKGAATFLFEAWRRDICSHAKSALQRICPRHAKVLGNAMVCDAETLSQQLGRGDLAFVDPPYSGVHYSRFYHVLETVAHGDCGDIAGTGRYPPPHKRPKSEFSIRSKAKRAVERLLELLAERGVRVVLTFPKEETSNGLSGPAVEDLAKTYFKCTTTIVNGRFSTLGGNSENRKARIPAYEAIIVMSPR